MFGFWFYCPVEHILFYPKATYPKSKEWNMTLQTSGKQIGRKRGLLLTFPVPLGWSYGRVRYFHRTRSFGGWLGVKASWGKTWKSWAGNFSSCEYWRSSKIREILGWQASKWNILFGLLASSLAHRNGLCQRSNQDIWNSFLVSKMCQTCVLPVILLWFAPDLHRGPVFCRVTLHPRSENPAMESPEGFAPWTLSVGQVKWVDSDSALGVGHLASVDSDSAFVNLCWGGRWGEGGNLRKKRKKNVRNRRDPVKETWNTLELTLSKNQIQVVRKWIIVAYYTYCHSRILNIIIHS